MVDLFFHSPTIVVHVTKCVAVKPGGVLGRVQTGVEDWVWVERDWVESKLTGEANFFWAIWLFTIA